MKFQTNINCEGCIEQVKPYLEAISQINSWDVDTQSSGKILTVEGEVDSETVQQAVSDAGFQAHPVQKGFFKKLFG